MVPGRGAGGSGQDYPDAMRSTMGFALAIALSVLLTAPAFAATGGLTEAVGRMPTGTTDMGFTDWERIRESLGAQDVTGTSPIDDKMAVVMATTQREAAAAGFGAAYLQRHRDAWRWDTLDVDWEAIYSVDGPPVAIVHLREGVDMDAIADRYDAYGFTTEEVGDVIVRSHELDASAEWMGTTELGVSNTAFLDDGRTLMFSSDREALADALGHRPSMLVPGATGVMDALGDPSAAWLVFGPSCSAFSPLPFDPFDPDASIGPLPSGQPLHPWTALGIGYQRPDWQPVGRIAMGFLDPAHAEADLGPRSTIARDGMSLRVQRPSSEAVFGLEDARVEGTTLVLDVSPVDDMPRRLFQMLQARDMAFAGC